MAENGGGWGTPVKTFATKSRFYAKKLLRKSFFKRGKIVFVSAHSIILKIHTKTSLGNFLTFHLCVPSSVLIRAEEDLNYTVPLAFSGK